jgi:malto-oligosyltrehalose synthase
VTTLPASTYRLQLHARFDFDAARAVVPYLYELGVDWIYLSPVFAARQGSEHGYDVIDPGAVNAALGGREGLVQLADDVHAAGMKVLVDIVPNHQAVTTQNPRWTAMLRDGEGSQAARWFDVDWSGNDRVPARKLAWPVLALEPHEEIERGALALDRGPDGAAVLRYDAETLPVVGDLSADLTDVLAAQSYVLLQWRTGSPFRNYRRFFDVSELVGVRVEDDEIFAASHELLGELLRDGVVDGIRVDHVDGLADPAAYLVALRAMAGAVPIFVEKILATGETLPAEWPVDGTTGYEYTNDLTALLVDPDGRAVLEAALRDENEHVPFPTVQRRAEREVLRGLFVAEWAWIRRRLADAALEDALAALTVALPVYRTYGVGGQPWSPRDREWLARAAEIARSELDADPGAVNAAVQRLVSDGELLVRWQQLTGAVMAKGHEDTACYRYPALLAQAEVGGDPGDPVLDAVVRTHDRARARLADGRLGMTATSTHDTKRSEDVRARLAALSERADAFELALGRWRALVQPAEGVTRVEARFVAQTLLGVWPTDERDIEATAARVDQYLVKALREAKQLTSWLDPDESHEADVRALARRSFEDGGQLLRKAFGSLLDELVEAGERDALAQLTWKLGLPGTADIYQGTELLDLSLVDPDNRRPVDFDARARLLATGEAPPKLRYTTAGLRARREHRELFVAGDYMPLDVAGAFAFARRAGAEWAIVIARVPGPPPSGALALPDGAPSTWTDVYTERAHAAPLAPGEILGAAPAALLIASA